MGIMPQWKWDVEGVLYKGKKNNNNNERQREKVPTLYIRMVAKFNAPSVFGRRRWRRCCSKRYESWTPLWRLRALSLYSLLPLIALYDSCFIPSSYFPKEHFLLQITTKLGISSLSFFFSSFPFILFSILLKFSTFFLSIKNFL